MPSTDPTAWTDHSHLFPGAIVVADVANTSQPTALHLQFADEVRTEAELLDGDDGRPVLAVRAYRTAAGTEIPAKLWTLSQPQRRNDGSFELRIGARLPFTPRAE